MATVQNSEVLSDKVNVSGICNSRNYA